MMNNPNSIQKFIFEHLPIRGQIVRLNQSYQEILQKHVYPEPVKLLLAESILSSILMMGSTKCDGHITLQFQSDAYVKLLIARCTSNFQIRALAQLNTEIEQNTDQSSSLLGTGELVVTLFHSDGQPYQSIIPLQTGGITTSLEHYFSQSEQLETRFILTASTDDAFGIMLQLLPQANQEDKYLFNEKVHLIENWLNQNSWQDKMNEEIILSLLPEYDLRIFDEQPIQVNCSCSIERMENALIMYGEEEVRKILLSNRFVEVTCEFCNKSYDFDEAAINSVFKITKH